MRQPGRLEFHSLAKCLGLAGENLSFLSPSAGSPPPVLGDWVFPGKNPAPGLLGSVSRVPRGAVDGGSAGTDGLKDISKREGSGVVSEQHFGFVVYSWVLVLLGTPCILLGGILIPRKT